MIQVYTGPGKGKTTAAFGLAIRAAAAGMKVYIAQFLKKGKYSELKVIRKIKGIKVEQFGTGCFINKKFSKRDIAIATKGLNSVKNKVLGRKFDIIILDEVNIALYYGLLDLKEVLQLIKNSQGIEIVLTGRYCPKAIIKQADLVSEIKETKHYYKKGIKARKGIEF